MRVRMIRPSYWTDRPKSVLACALYRLSDAEGALLYVGIAFEPRWRLLHHRRKAWGASIDDVTVEWFASEGDARAAEIRAIRDEIPIHNVQRYPVAGRVA